jgi:hypothetical protein
MSKVPFKIDNGIEPTSDGTVDLGAVGARFRNVRLSADAFVGNDLTVSGEFNQGGVAAASEEDAIVYAVVLGL